MALPQQSTWVHSNPRGPAIGQRGFTDQSIWAFEYPFNQNNWPNPVRRASPVGEQTGFIDPSEVWLFGLVAPPHQTDWPNPKGRTPPIAGFVNSSPLNLLGQDRFFGAPGEVPSFDYPNPRGRPPLNQGFTNATALKYTGQDSFFGAPGQAPVYDYPNPRGRAGSPVGWTDTYPNRTAVVTTLPFSQPDWPNPKGAKGGSGFVDQSIWAFEYPFSQTDWQNPTLRKPQGLSFSYNTSYLLGAGTAPFSQTNWPNPQPFKWTKTPGHLDGVIIGLDAFYQTEWPNPLRRTAPHVGFIDAYPNRGGVVAAPFAQTDWPIPQRRSVAPVGFVDAYPNRTVGLKPFLQADWSNPRGAKGLNQGFINPAHVRFVGQDRIYAGPGQVPTYAFPNPRGRGPVQSWIDTWPNRGVGINAYTLTAVSGSFVLTGGSAILTYGSKTWIPAVKTSEGWSAATKDQEIWIPAIKETEGWTDE